MQTNLIRVQGPTKSLLRTGRIRSPLKSSLREECTQTNLLKFPAIPLEETIPKFLASVKPLLNESEYKETEKEAKNFMEKEGKELQSLLQKAACAEDNWLAPRWLRVAYLQYRDPVTVFTSPGMTFPMTNFESDEEWLEYTANIINCMAQFKLMVDNCKIPVVKMGKFELDNSQFGKVFGTNRVPVRTEDEMEWNPDSRHVVVLYKNHVSNNQLYHIVIQEK